MILEQFIFGSLMLIAFALTCLRLYAYAKMEIQAAEKSGSKADKVWGYAVFVFSVAAPIVAGVALLIF